MALFRFFIFEMQKIFFNENKNSDLNSNQTLHTNFG